MPNTVSWKSFSGCLLRNSSVSKRQPDNRHAINLICGNKRCFLSLKGKNKRFSDCGSITGFAANKCSIAGNHGCVGHTGKMKIPLAESDLIFAKSLFSKQNGGNPYEKKGAQLKEKASVIRASGSGNQETKFNVRLFSLDANRSRSGSPKRLHISKKTSLFKHHSISSLKLREKKISNDIVWSRYMGSSQPEIVPHAPHPNTSSKKIKFTRVGTPHVVNNKYTQLHKSYHCKCGHVIHALF